MTHKNRKKSRIFMFLSTGCSLLRAEGFSCSLGVFYVGLGIGKLQFLIQKKLCFFSAVIFYQFLVIKAWIRIRDPDLGSGSGIRIRNQKKCWIRIHIRIRIKSMRIRNPALQTNLDNQNFGSATRPSASHTKRRAAPSHHSFAAPQDPQDVYVSIPWPQIHTNTLRFVSSWLCCYQEI